MSKEQEVLKLVSDFPNLSNREIGKVIGLHRATVSYYLLKNGIRRDRVVNQKLNNTNRNTPVNISKRATEILVGTLLGDSHVSKYHRDSIESAKILNSNISCGHSIKQKEYVLYLQNLLNEEGIITHFRENNKEYSSFCNGRRIISIGRCDLSTRRSITFNSWRDLWYVNGIKRVPSNIEEYFTPLCIAIWFMDDGSKNNCSYYLHTEGFLLEDIEYLRNLFKTKYNINTKLHNMRGKHIIYICSDSKIQFAKMILPYICDSMKYKIFESHNIGSE